MFKITQAVRDFLAQKGWIVAEAEDAKVQRTIAAKMASGELKASEITKLSKQSPKPPEKKNPEVVASTVEKMIADAIGKHAATLNVEGTIQKQVQDALNVRGMGRKGPRPEVVLSQEETTKVRLRSVSEKFSNIKSPAIYADRSGRNATGSINHLAGKQATYEGRQVFLPSELDKAEIGACAKWLINRNTPSQDIPAGLKMTDLDRDLVEWSLHERQWNGVLHLPGSGEGIKVEKRRLNPMEIKAVLDDSTGSGSGGIEITPYAFDEAVITYPLLYGEVFPYVSTTTLARGRRVKGGTIANPTLTPGVAEGTAMTPITTTDFIAPFDTVIYPTTGALEIGLDFEEDSPVPFGDLMVERFGLASLAQLDYYAAIGSGSNQPLGMLNTVGATSFPSQAGAGGPVTRSDIEGMILTMQKRFRNEPNANLMFVTNDNTYRHIMAIRVGPTDQRGLWGTDIQQYRVAGIPIRIQNDIADGRIGFVNATRYRMYRRLGSLVKIVREGYTLAKSNMMAVIFRMRWGGQMELGGAVVVSTDFQAA